MNDRLSLDLHWHQTVPPWHIGHDSCGPPSAPPVPFAQVFLVILSSADDLGQQFRHVFRGNKSWQRRFQELAGAGSPSAAAFISCYFDAISIEIMRNIMEFE